MPPLNLSFERKQECKYCGRLFHFKWGLVEHVRRMHENIKPHKCDLCQKSFVNKGDLKAHINSHNERSYKCKYCEKTFKTKQGRNLHVDTHGLNQYECSICKETFKQRYKLYQHKKEHKKGSTDSLYECPHCWYTFSTIAFKNEHVSKAHNKLILCEKKASKPHNVFKARNARIKKEWLSKVVKVAQQAENFPKLIYTCVDCGQEEQNATCLRKHMKTAHPGEKINDLFCQQCGKKISCNYYLAHMMSHYNIKPFACDVCDSTFSRKHELNIHMNSHITLKSFKCSECPSKFKSMRHLQVHERRLHSSEIHTCNICSRIFKSNILMRYHIIRVHDRAENCVKCTVCKRVVFKKELCGHMKKFHDEVEKLCEICGISFKNAFYLKSHLKKCMNVKVEPPCPLDIPVKSCFYCLFSHQNASVIREHCLKNHEDKLIECHCCDKIFLCKGSYERHQTYRKNIAPYYKCMDNSECSFCGFIADEAESLAEHLKTHEYFECYFCGFVTSRTTILAEHLKGHEYCKWLLSWNQGVVCYDKSFCNTEVYNDRQILCRKEQKLDYELSLLIKVEKEISWINDLSGEAKRRSKIHQTEKNKTKTDKTRLIKVKKEISWIHNISGITKRKSNHQSEKNKTMIDETILKNVEKEISWFHDISGITKRRSKIHQAEKNKTKTDETILVNVEKEISQIHDISGGTKQRSEIHQAKQCKTKTDKANVCKPWPDTYPSRSYLVANPCLKSKGNLSTLLKKNNLKQEDKEPEVIDIEVDEISSPSLSCNEKFETDESQEAIFQKNHSSIDSENSDDINVVTKFNLADNRPIPLKPFIYLEDLKNLDECSLKNLLSSFKC